MVESITFRFFKVSYPLSIRQVTIRMSETVLAPVESPRRFHFDWVPAVFFHPRQTFAKIASQTRGVWLTPILILSLTALLQVLVTGSIKQAAALSGEVSLPPNFQYYSPEQQAQFQQAMAATSGPVFLYVFPAIVALFRVWLGWLLVGGLLHLVLTMLGGRGDTGAAMNLVAWASLPLALRELVRAAAMYSSKQLISAPGISGFVTPDGGNLSLFLASLLALVDIYLVWHAILLIVGVRAGNGISSAKATGGVFITLLIVLTLQTLISYFTTKLGGLTIIRPFF
jgi:hypothetical protein